MVAPIKTQFGTGASSMTTAIIVLIAMLIAYVFTDLGVMVVLNGALSVSGFITLAPALVGLYLIDANKMAMYGLLIFGVVMTMLAFLLPHVEQLKTSCLFPVLYQ